MQADMVGDFLLCVSVLSLSNAKIKDLTLLFGEENGGCL